MENNIKNIMLIDDSEIDLKVNSRIIVFSKLAEKVIECSSAESAFEYLKTHQDKQELLPELILLDIQMPEMNGFEFLALVENLPSGVTDHCKIYMLSSTVDFRDIKMAEANPLVIKLLKKPLNIKELIIQHQLNQLSNPAS